MPASTPRARTRVGQFAAAIGLPAIAVSTDELVISERGGGGTEVRMRFLLAGAAEMSPLASGSIDSAPAPA